MNFNFEISRVDYIIQPLELNKKETSFNKCLLIMSYTFLYQLIFHFCFIFLHFYNLSYIYFLLYIYICIGMTPVISVYFINMNVIVHKC